MLPCFDDLTPSELGELFAEEIEEQIRNENEIKRIKMQLKFALPLDKTFNCLPRDIIRESCSIQSCCLEVAMM